MNEQWPSELDTTTTDEYMEHIRDYNQRHRESFERGIETARDMSKLCGRIARYSLFTAVACALLYIALEVYSRLYP
jgi:hypothetical protein